MAIKFSNKTFKYFDEAQKNAFDKEWFVDNKNLYEEHVKAPFVFMVNAINLELDNKLYRINTTEKSICRPLRPSNRAIEKGFVKDFISIDFMEKKTSLFEWNPGFHIQIGAKKDDNFFGGGLYMVSGRQIKLLREAFNKDYETIKKLTQKKAFKDSWGQMVGDKYKRFPKDYDIDSEMSEFLWFKQFYFSQTPNRKEIIKKDFIPKLVQDFKNSVEILNWIRDAVGVYKK